MENLEKEVLVNDEEVNTSLAETKEENNEIKPYDPKNYKVATIEEYGFKDHKVLKKIWSITSKILLGFSIFMLYFAVIIIAIQSFNSSDNPAKFESFTFSNYTHMFDKKSLNDSIINTFKTSIFATGIATVLGTFIAIGAYFLKPAQKKLLTLLNNIPLLNADIVTGISFMLIFSLFLPIFRYIFGFWTILFAHIYFITPYIILSVLPKMKEIDGNMLDASLDLGVKPFKSLIKVIIPAIFGGIFSGMILAFTISFEDFVVGYLSSGNAYDTLSIWIYSSIGKKSLFPGVYAFSTALTVLTIIVIVVYNLITKGVHKREKASNR
ncbi:MAG: ABC transporter permease [Acholeplasmatales bacterium]|nr:ABC transporter permease [Acholeplasmatales bacterium]